jgi:hypothetical protein
MSKKNLTPSVAEPTLETRRDVLKLSLAVAAFGAAMGIAGRSVAAGGEANKNSASRTGGRPKTREKLATNGRVGRPKMKEKEATNNRSGSRPKSNEKPVYSQ